ncbi:TraG family conjugative transposon ATPase [Porphyromonas levii]|uniref:TraG family conjugative transposon ATPase n=1 Tax=Porphyromonas levii TaxID=28114 RepID=UPI00036A6FFF|nr:TraG family conjugative transposon ATPase [Porphyromonas levii]
MRARGKITVLDRLFPIMSVESGYVISKNADVTALFEVHLPEIFTVTEGDYSSIHDMWHKAIKVLPSFTILHKQDWFLAEKYEGDKVREGHLGFLDTAYQAHFYERPYLDHTCYLYITKTTEKRMYGKSDTNTLARGYLVPQEIQDKEIMNNFIDSVSQFERIINDSGYVKLRRLTDEDILGAEGKRGLLDFYFALNRDKEGILEDITQRNDGITIGQQELAVYTISQTEHLPNNVSTDKRFDKLSTDKSDTRLSFASPIGLLLSCDHIYNQYLFIADHSQLEKFEASGRRMRSLSKLSSKNVVNASWINEYVSYARTYELMPVKAHCNVMVWGKNKDELSSKRNEVGSALSSMGCSPRHNTIDAPVLYWSGIPGNSADFPAEESFWTFIAPALCLWTNETNYRSSVSPFGIKLADRISGKPVHVDISDLPMKMNVTTNRNKFILGPSGSGKSFFTNHMVSNYYKQGTHITLIDTGNSYEGLCALINQKTKGEDGIYYTYTEEKPISFNPFYTDDYVYDVEKKESLTQLILTLWRFGDEKTTKTELTELSSSIAAYVELIQSDRTIRPCFNTYYEYLRDVYRAELQQRDIKVHISDFNINNLLNTLKPYYKGGDYDFLLNSDANIDLLNKRFIVFEIDSIKDNKILFPVVTLVIMESFINKLRHLKGERKMIVIEEAWKAIASPNMADFIKYLYKTVRKHYGEAVVVTQDPDDILKSEVVRESIINNSDCKILLDQRKYMYKFDEIQNALGLTEKEKQQILSINMNNDPLRKYLEVWIGLGSKISAVYACEVSLEEYYTYTTEALEKVEVQEMAKLCGGDMEQAIKRVCRNKREK